MKTVLKHHAIGIQTTKWDRRDGENMRLVTPQINEEAVNYLTNDVRSFSTLCKEK